MTPCEAHFKKKPTRTWTEYINKGIKQEGPVIKDEEIHIRIKEKMNKATDKMKNKHNRQALK